MGGTCIRTYCRVGGGAYIMEVRSEILPRITEVGRRMILGGEGT